MSNLSTHVTDEEGMPSPTSNNQMTALVNTDESEGLPIEADKESEGPPGVISGEIEIVPSKMVSIVNENLKNCASCKKCPLKLEFDHRIGFALSWKLSCTSCKKDETATINRIKYLKQKRETALNKAERRKLGKETS